MKSAPFWKFVGAGNVTADERKLLAFFSLHDARGEQTDRIGMKRVMENLGHGSLFHDFSRVHHMHAVGNLRDDAQVMGDE